MQYYDKGELLSRKGYLNFVIGQRGNGKTYAFKTWCIDDYKKNKRQFVWIRRYSTEIQMMRGSQNANSFFGDVLDRYPNDKFEMKGNNKSGKFIINGEVMGFYFALSTSSIAKSNSFPNVDKIVFDEFLIIGNTYHYLADEVTLLFELIDTIFRTREIDGKIKPRGVYLIGNNVTIANPYFLELNIPPLKTRFWSDKTRGILVEKTQTQAFADAKKNTKFGQLIQGTKYYDYNIENISFNDSDEFIEPKSPNCDFYCAIDYKNRTLGFWNDYKNGLIYTNWQFDPSSYAHYSLTRDDHTTNTFLIKSLTRSRQMQNLIWTFRNGCMRFENAQVKACAYEVLSYFVR